MTTAVESSRIRGLLRGAFHLMGLVAIVLVVVEYGVLAPAGREVVAALGNGLLGGAAVAVLLRTLTARDRRGFLQRNKGHVIIAVVILARELSRRALAETLAGETLALPWLRHVLLGSMVLLESWAILTKLLATRRVGPSGLDSLGFSLRPLHLMLASFPGLAVVGALLLLLPRSRAENVTPFTFLDAFFTATSAVCVTGLTVRDIGTDLSPVGQNILLGLIQLGGLGIVTFAAAFSMLLGHRGNLAESAAMSEALDRRPVATAFRLVSFIVAFTLIVEAIGALLLLNSWPVAAGQSLVERWRVSAFQSISAFCNAGFSLEPNSIAGQTNDSLVLAVIALLIVIGGLGFAVHRELFEQVVERWQRFALRHRSLNVPERRPRRSSLHARLAIRLSLLLIVLGAALIYGFDWIQHGAGGIGVRESLFLSVSSRTAGFQTSDLSTLSHAGLFVVILLMFVGASPGSSGGGIKTTTLGVVVAAMRAMWRQRESVDLRKRSVGATTVRSAFVILTLHALIIVVATLCLLAAHPELGFLDVLFEAVSAAGTVGLSTGVTTDMGSFARIVLCVTMFLGRLGPLSIVVLIMRLRSPLTYRYPEEDLAVG